MRYLFFGLLFFCLINLLPPKVAALTCLSQADVYVSSYSKGRFIEGFHIAFESTGSMCDVIPIVQQSDSNQKLLFSQLHKALNLPLETGVYELTTQCTMKYQTDYCLEETKLERLSENPESLSTYISNWEDKRLKKLASINRYKRDFVVIDIGVPLVTILVSLIFAGVFRKRPKIQTLVLIISLVALSLIAVFWHFFIHSMIYWSYLEFQKSAFISIRMLLVAIIIEVLWIGIRILRK